MIAESQSQVFRDLDVMFENKEGVFDKDIINSNGIMNYVREKENGHMGIPNPRPILIHKIDQNKITDWITYREGVPIKKGHPVSITPSEIEHKKKARYHAIRNQDRWISCENLDLIREHMKEKEEEEKPKKEPIILSEFEKQMMEEDKQWLQEEQTPKLKLIQDDIPF